jgi:Autographiviridae endonuclease VII
MVCARYPVAATHDGSPMTCRVCNETKDPERFPIRPDTGRYRGECKACVSERARRSAERVEVGDARWLTRREGILLRKYGLTNADFARLARKQRGRCAICRKVPNSRRRNTRTGREWTALHVDHDHVTGEVRGLLCHRCNSQVGWAEQVGVPRVLAYLGHA